ncbi:NUDIX domain-containing protein [Yimella sp. cx-51]|uniref:NUDIX hydrolase n=1 Tax=Yimella sp. cx-51 TaxID=2770551 RepID=UPI00165E07C8|nr:NUDIX domain-containing protein [Yimella sp. cx-51]MBC9957820.1 NUDIX domain-containing protein [Yimella sp. cx-51]MBD2759545.1 NUDIX domain-containing protein [Yimella sp. cx-573]QTH37962.1 NUDIX domain-containing protein [Yimella sp. cx-51]
MRKARTDKVVCYIVVNGQLLVFTHFDRPLAEVGVQVPAGTIKVGESPEAAAVREAWEETGVEGLRVVRKLGESDYDMTPYRHEVIHRYFFELTSDTPTTGNWLRQELDPDGGSEAPTFRCYWIPLTQAHVLSGGLSNMIGALIDE